LYQLNPHQRDAVSHIHGPLLVLAGAGSGKTSVITQKISHLIRHCNYQPKHIAAITFTNKAAKEMAERVNEMLKDVPSKGLIVATFHNLGLRFIRQEIKHLSLRENFSIFDGADSLSLIKELSPVEIAADKSLLQAIQHGISNWKSDLIDPVKAIAMAKGQDQLIAAKLYQKYQRHLHAYNALDFDDLIRLPVELLQTNAEVRERWRNKIRYLLVDEYQDTNTCQYQFVKLLSGPRAHFTVVGDDDQSIYAWRGANPENLAILQKDYPALEVIKLEQNYRSSGRILKAANSLIDNNPHLFVKRLWSDHAYGEPIRVLELDNEEQEAERIGAEIITGHFNQKIPYSDYAVLYRGNHQSKLIEKAMLSNNIPYRVSGGTSFFARSEIKDVMAYLRLISNQDDDNAFLRIVNVPRREIGASTLEKLGTTASEENCSLYEATSLTAVEEQLTARRFKILQRFLALIEKIKTRIETHNLETELNQWFVAIGYKDWLIETSSNEKQAGYRWQNVEELLRWIGNMEITDDGQNQTLSTIIGKLMLRDRLDQQQGDELQQVELMTLHAAKGLEYPYVYMAGMEEEILPHRSSIEDDNIEEERRLAYVGITRAKKQLTITMAKRRKKYGEAVATEASRFLLELPEDDLKWEGKSTPLTQQQQQQNNQAHLANLRSMFNKS
jgi:ATP-dependent DNA helicase Rep